MAFSFKKTFPATWWLLASRRAHIAYMVLFGAAALVFSAIRIDAWVFRRRAEGLLREIQQIPLKTTSLAEARKRLGKYPELQTEGDCEAAGCRLSVKLVHLDWVRRAPYRWDPDYSSPIYRILLHLGLKPARVVGSLRVRREQVLGKAFVVWATDSDGYTVIADARTVSTLWPYASGGPYWDLHPNYYAHRPGGCTFCTAMEVEFTPEASSQEIERALSFDLSCLSRIKPCSEPADLMPAAARDYEEDLSRYEQYWSLHAPCTLVRLKRYGRDHRGVVLAEVVRVYPSHPDQTGELMQEVDYKPIEVLKDAIPKSLRRLPHVLPRTPALLAPDGRQLSPQTFAPGKRVLIFFDGIYPGVEEDCGAVPATEENLRAVKEGVAQDGSF